MSGKKIGNIVFKTGEYEQNGEKKGRYVRCGVLFQGEDGGFYGILDSVPVGGHTQFSVYADKPREQRQERGASSTPPGYDNNTPPSDFPY